MPENGGGHACPRRIGKYLVSPLIRILDNGWFASSVSIGAGGTQRVLRMTRLFRGAEQAAAYACAEARQWIFATHGAPPAA